MKKFEIICDFAIDSTIGFRKILDIFGGSKISMEILQKQGPGGGWPEFKLKSNDKAKLVDALEKLGFEKDYISEYLETHVPVN